MDGCEVKMKAADDPSPRQFHVYALLKAETSRDDLLPAFWLTF
jgi:hypothetical protein